MRKIVRALSIFLVVLCCLMQSLSVRADLIHEPVDAFQKEHAEECTRINARFTTNGPDGTVEIYESPESDMVRAYGENGREITIYYAYRDANGVEWGMHWYKCWTPMDQLKAVEDKAAFLYEHYSKIQKEEGILAEEKVYLYSYPGSSRCFEQAYSKEDLPKYNYVYTDAYGLRWGRETFYELWINLDDPTADYDTLYARQQQIVRQRVTVAVLAVVTVTGVLLLRLKRRK